MHDPSTLDALVDDLVRHGFDQARAERAAVAVGDCPELDGAFVLVRDEGGAVIDQVPAVWVYLD